MNKTDQLKETITAGYTFKGDYITLGAALYEGQPLTGTLVNLPLKTLNRHGLIAGATGTGKTKTLQVIAENLSKNGVPVLLMDLKGDLSGIAEAGTVQPFITERSARHRLGVWCGAACSYFRPERCATGCAGGHLQVLR